ncbi:helix-turn-helix domain-containing protein [Marinococcus luteus]|uniref:helix-turn-helix domain-containing protein n=1 Tax=Marinococcus luteus TaxID=1122204 RepID=UPI002ACC7482|nr:helix-turn-helix domain-containing protein [Marinococcus luteus]MDZ5782099.1 helix-turn-helix domain-containing protein [Marinococcus luteus]
MAKGKYARWLEPEGLTLLEGWARDGLTDEQIAHNMGIATGTLYEYKKKYAEINEALKAGKEVVDLKVENALLRRALGYEYEEITYEFGEETKRVTKQQTPDTTAQIFWLKNRKPKEWRDKQDHMHSGPEGGPIEHKRQIDLSTLSEEELNNLETIISRSADSEGNPTGEE